MVVDYSCPNQTKDFQNATISFFSCVSRVKILLFAKSKFFFWIFFDDFFVGICFDCFLQMNFLLQNYYMLKDIQQLKIAEVQRRKTPQKTRSKREDKTNKQDD